MLAYYRLDLLRFTIALNYFCNVFLTRLSP
jgi:hypothetical protein